MLRMYDFKCNLCNKVEEHIVTETEVPFCMCGNRMEKLPPIVERLRKMSPLKTK